MERADIEKLAKLSRLDIAENEMESLVGELRSILGYVEEVQTISTGARNDSYGNSTPLNIMRADEGEHPGGVSTESLLKNAPRTTNGFIEVNQVFE